MTRYEVYSPLAFVHGRSCSCNHLHRTVRGVAKCMNETLKAIAQDVANGFDPVYVNGVFPKVRVFDEGQLRELNSVETQEYARVLRVPEAEHTIHWLDVA